MTPCSFNHCTVSVVVLPASKTISVLCVETSFAEITQGLSWLAL